MLEAVGISLGICLFFAGPVMAAIHVSRRHDHLHPVTPRCVVAEIGERPFTRTWRRDGIHWHAEEDGGLIFPSRRQGRALTRAVEAWMEGQDRA